MNSRIIKGKPTRVWQLGDQLCPEMLFLLYKRLITINPQDNIRYFNATNNGAHVSASSDAVIIFRNVTKNEFGFITNVDFVFAA